MDDHNTISIIDYGSSKIRLGVHDQYLPNSKFIIDELYKYDDNNFSNDDVLKKIILNTEKEIKKHLQSLSVMIDNGNYFSVDLSYKKKIDNQKINTDIINKTIQEAKSIIEENYKNFKILHLIVVKYILDKKNYFKLNEDIYVNDFTIEIKFLLSPINVINKIKDSFKKNHISIDKILCSSYVKTLLYNKYFEKYDVKVFIDIGFLKTSILIYFKDRLKFIDYIPIGGENITKDISSVLEVDKIRAERIKKKFNQSNATFESEDNQNNLLIKIVHARVEEIIDLSFKNYTDIEFLKNKKSILVFTGEGSKILSKNSIYLKEQYNYFDEMSFFEESSEIICDTGLYYMTNKDPYEITLSSKKPKNRGFFEKIFYFFSR